MIDILHTYKDIENKKIIFFDLDGTLINTASGKTFPQDITDFKINKKALDIISSLNNVDYVFIVSNQAGVPTYYTKEAFNIKFETISSFIKEYINTFKEKKLIDFKSLYCTAKGFSSKNRKPNTGMLERCLKNIKYNKVDCLMVGDASGIHNEKRDDFSDSDLRTARNFDIDYMDIDDFLQISVNSKV